MKSILILLSACALSVQAMAQVPSPLKPGEKAPALSFATPDDKTLTLSEVNKDAYVLVDFWASWCGPCRRMGNPHLVEIYKEMAGKKFKGAKNGFRVLSVSLDQNKDAWVKAIGDDKLPWPYHMSDLGGWQSKTAALYGVQYIPQAFLIDPKGKLVGSYNMTDPANTLKADLEKNMAN